MGGAGGPGVCTGFECYVTRYITINMTAKKFYMPRYKAFWSLDITDYMTIKTGNVHIYIEIFNEYIPLYITCTFKRLCILIH